MGVSGCSVVRQQSTEVKSYDRIPVRSLLNDSSWVRDWRP